MITFTLSQTDKELSEIIDLQKSNLAQNLAKEEIISQGFVTVAHSLEDLQKMNSYEHNVVTKDNEKIVGYLLAMTKNSRSDIPILLPMFDAFDKIVYNGKPVSQYQYIVVGQVCIHKNYRGQGLLDKCYDAYKTYFKEKYDFAITEIATTNLRSINAHKRIGFSEIHRYEDPQQTAWSVVLWDWNNINSLS